MKMLDQNYIKSEKIHIAKTIYKLVRFLDFLKFLSRNVYSVQSMSSKKMTSIAPSDRSRVNSASFMKKGFKTIASKFIDERCQKKNIQHIHYLFKKKKKKNCQKFIFHLNRRLLMTSTLNNNVSQNRRYN